MIARVVRFASRFSIRNQGRMLLLTALIPSVTIPAGVATYYESRLVHRELESRARVLCDSLAARAQRPLLDYDIVELDDLVESIRQAPESYEALAYAVVVDSEGRVLSDSQEYAAYGTVLDDDAARAARLSVAPELVQWLEPQGLLEISRPIEVHGKRWGTVRVGVSLHPLRVALARDAVRNFLITLVVGLLLAFSVSRVFTQLFLAPVYRLAGALEAIGHRDFSVHIEHDRKDEIGGVFDVVNRTARLLEERERLYETFGRYVTTQVRDAILSGQVSAHGRKVHAAILFADLRGFTARSESMPEGEVLELLNVFCSRMTTAIHAHGGIVDKFIGDSVMAVFGAPIEDPQCTMKAIRAIEAMREELNGINTELAASGKEPLRMGVGLHVGDCVAGSVGPVTRQQYTVVGDTVNLASRLQDLSKQFGVDVVVSEAVVKECGTALVTRDLGETPVEGREQPVRTFQLLSAEYDRASSEDLLQRERERERDSAS